MSVLHAEGTQYTVVISNNINNKIIIFVFKHLLLLKDRKTPWYSMKRKWGAIVNQIFWPFTEIPCWVINFEDRIHNSKITHCLNYPNAVAFSDDGQDLLVSGANTMNPNCQCRERTLKSQVVWFYRSYRRMTYNQFLLFFCWVLKIPTVQPWLVCLSGLGVIPRTERSLVRLPVRARAWVVGQVPSWGRVRGNQLMFLSLPLSLPSSLSENK